jgi:hypothetical protein
MNRFNGCPKNHRNGCPKNHRNGVRMLPDFPPNSNFLVFSEAFYIERFGNRGYRYYLGKEPKKALQINKKESKADQKNRFVKLMKKNNWTRVELAKHLEVSRAWITKVLKN